MAGRTRRRGLLTAALMAVAVPLVALLALLNTPSGRQDAVVEARQPLGHEAQRPPWTEVTFTPEALPEAIPALEAPVLEPAPGPATGVLRLVYFVEADATPDDRAIELIGAQGAALQLFWYEQFGGTFALPAEGVDIVYGDHPAQWYDQTTNGDEPRWNRLLNIQDEVRAKLAVGTDDVRMVVYPATRLDGRVGAIRYVGAWLDGDDVTCIDGSVATVPYAEDYPANCLMTAAHELGHVYGLGHQGADAYCMQFGFYRYVNDSRNCEFSPLSREQVANDGRNEGWLDAEPGERR